MTIRVYATVMSLAVMFCAATNCCAQGLILHLPEDGTGVEYEGVLTQENVRPDLPDGKETLQWSRELSIKSIGREDADYNGTVQPCRWIEIKVVTGSAGAAGIDPGPVGARIYKVLVPESKIIDTAVDADTIPNHMLPIVKGYRRLGESQVQEIRSLALRVYPTISLLTNYDDVETIATAETPQTNAPQSFSARRLKGTLTMERPMSRSTNVGEFWVSREVPFGLARWEVTVTREEKESTAPRDQFRNVSTVKSVMSVKRLLTTAESELVTE
jgi:hypothetical protein